MEFDILIVSDALDADFASRDTGIEIEAFGTWILMVCLANCYFSEPEGM